MEPHAHSNDLGPHLAQLPEKGKRLCAINVTM